MNGYQAFWRLMQWSLLLVGYLVLGSCVPSENSGVGTISSLFPAGRADNLPAFILTVKGEGFAEDTQVVFNGKQKPTTWRDATRLECRIEPADMKDSAADGAALDGEQLIPVQVYSQQSGESSAPVSFHISAEHIFLRPAEIPLPTGQRIEHLPIAAFMDQRMAFVAWDYWSGSETHYFYTMSEDGGQNWITPKTITLPEKDLIEPLLLCREVGRLCVLYLSQTGDFMVAESSDMGDHWSSAQIPLSAASRVNASLKQLFADQDGNTYAVISGGKGHHVFKKAMGETNWQTLAAPPFTRPVYTCRFFVTPVNGLFHAIWVSSQPPGPGETYDSPEQIFLKTYSFATSNWSEDMTTGFTKPGYHWFSFWDEKDRFAVLTDLKGVHVTLTEDHGLSWNGPVALTQGSTYGFWADMDLCGNLNVISHQQQGGHYIMRSKDGGKTFSTARFLSELHEGHPSLWIHWIGMSPQGDIGMFWTENNDGLQTHLFFTTTVQR